MKTLTTIALAALTLSPLASAQSGSTGDYPFYSGQRKMAIIILDWADKKSPSRQDVVNRMWNDSKSARNYYLDMSRGTFEFTLPAGSAGGVAPASTPDVYGPYELSIAAGYSEDITYANADNKFGGNMVPGSHSVARALAAADGYVASNYDYIMYVTPKTDSTGGIRGWAGYHANYSHNFEISHRTINHELGHDLGLTHSNFGFDVNNYSSHDCVMANSTCPHLDGPHSYQLGWYPDSCFGIRGFGQYDIENLAQPGSDKLKVLRFDRGAAGATTNPSYNLWAEYRMSGVGHDDQLNGNWNRKVSIHLSAPSSNRPGDSYQWYKYNNNLSYFEVGGEYTDPDYVCTARFVRENPSDGSATVQFIDPNGNQPPMITAGQAFVFGVGSHTFNLLATDPENDPLTYTVVSAPANGTLTHSGGAFSYTCTTPGSYSFVVRVNDGQYDSFDATIPLKVAGAGLPIVDAGLDQTMTFPDPSNMTPGLFYGEVPGNIDVTTPNPATSQITNVAAMTENSIAANTTEIYTGQIFDADGVISFTEQIDDRTRIWIDGLLVLTSDYHGDRVSTANLALTPGWHDIEIRISNGSGGSGPVGSPGIGFDPAGGTAWQTLVDPGDGSFLRAYNPQAKVSLNGTASDPDGDQLTLTWSVVSGPGIVEFIDVANTSTAAIFSTAGSYVLRLAASDGLNTSHDDVTITINPGASADISVAGNGREIANGDLTPESADDTHMGAIAVGSNASKTYTIRNSGISNLTLTGSPMVEISGSSDFSVSMQPSTGTIGSGGSASFTIAFSPTTSGVQSATISIASNDPDESTYVFSVSGGINTPPVVNAGPDRSLQLINAWTGKLVSLSGATATDPDGDSLSFAWSVTSGTAGGVSFSNASALSPNATFKKSGTYTLRLTATDGIDTVHDDMTVTVSIKTYSVTYAGNGHTGGSVPVDGNIYNYGDWVTVLPNTSNLTRSGYALIGWNTAANGSGAGYKANDTFSITGDVTLHAQWAMTFSQWSGGAAFGDDANEDGVSNGMAWLLGAQNKEAQALQLLPVVDWNQGHITYTFSCLRSEYRLGTILKVQISDDLGINQAWSNREALVTDSFSSTGDIVISTQPNTNDPRLIDVTVMLESPPGQRRFYRLHATP